MELAALLFAGISAAMASIQAWQNTRNKQAAAAEFDATFERTKDSDEAKAAAKELVGVAPPEVVSDLEARADECWTGYRKVLGGDYLPYEVDKATRSVQACVCRELGRIYELTGGAIPDRWQGEWDTYKCQPPNLQPAKERVKV